MCLHYFLIVPYHFKRFIFTIGPPLPLAIPTVAVDLGFRQGGVLRIAAIALALRRQTLQWDISLKIFEFLCKNHL